jgi:hypothetical protein
MDMTNYPDKCYYYIYWREKNNIKWNKYKSLLPDVVLLKDANKFKRPEYIEYWEVFQDINYFLENKLNSYYSKNLTKAKKQKEIFFEYTLDKKEIFEISYFPEVRVEIMPNYDRDVARDKNLKL